MGAHENPILGQCAMVAEAVTEMVRANLAATDATQAASALELTAAERRVARMGIPPAMVLSFRQAIDYLMPRGAFDGRSKDEAIGALSTALDVACSYARTMTPAAMRAKLNDAEATLVDLLRLDPAAFLGARVALGALRKPGANLSFAERQASFLADVKEAQDARLVVDEAYVTKLAAGHQVPVPGVRK